MRLDRGSVVLVKGHRFNVLAVQFGLAWLAGGAWCALALVPVHACVHIRNTWWGNGPWEVN